MGEWVRLCSHAELPAEGEAKEFSVAGKTLCVATLGGKPLALDNVCPHRGGPLAEGTIEAGKVVCPWHQWEFDLATGVSTHSQEAKVATYALQQKGEDVFVEI
jgi:nitrite reductase (NADH) small subunit